MFNIDLQLRTPGRILLMERNQGQALLDRAFEPRPQQQGSGWLPRLMNAFTPKRPAAMDDDDDGIPHERVAMPSIRWASADVEYGQGYAILDGIAIIDIKGVLTPEGYVDWWEWCWVDGYLQIGAAIEAASADSRIRGIFLRINSPGGFVDGCFDLAKSIRGLAARSGGKPIWAHAHMACSAAYALASGVDRIISPAEGDVGSIGVLIQHVDMTKMLDEWGIKVEAIQSGARKTDGASWKPLTDDARAHLQGVVDQIAKTFVATVVEGRGLTEEAIRAQEARWFIAHHDDPAQSGQALGLVDDIANERDAFALFLQSLSGETEDGAPAAAGTVASAETEESEMSLADQIKALREKAAKGDKSAIAELKKLGIAPKAEADDTEEKDETTETEEKDDETSETEETDETKDEDEDAEPAASATGSKAGFALLDSKEAKGRDGLAKKLAAKVGAKKLTFGEAKDMLAAAPKSSRLSESVRDHNPGGDTGGSSKAGAGLTAAIDRMVGKKN